MILKNLYIVGEEDDTKDITIGNEIITDIKPRGNNYFNDEVILNFEDCIAFPGLINSHDHLEFNLYPQLGHKIYEDYVAWGKDIHSADKAIIDLIESVPAELRIKYGIIKNLLNGVTTVIHHGANFIVPNDSPISVMTNFPCIHSVRLGRKWKLKLNLIERTDFCVIHIGEGINPESYEEINELIRWNLFRRKVIGVHAIAMTEKQSKNFHAIIWCPVSNLHLFNKTADINFLKKNTRILFGTDSALTGGRNIWDHIRKARSLGSLNDEELISSLTDSAASVWGMKDRGKISIDKKADIIITKKRSPDIYESFFQNNPEDILLILKDGKVILYDELVGEYLTQKNSDDFVRVSVSGKIKFVNYPVGEIICEIKKHASAFEFPPYNVSEVF